MSKNPFLGLGMHTWTQKFDRGNRPDLIYIINNNAEEFIARTGYQTSAILINWGDGSPTETVTTTVPSHTYASAGIYKIKIYTLDSDYWPYFNVNLESRSQIISVKVRTKPGVIGYNYGTGPGSPFAQYYRSWTGCSNLTTYKQKKNSTKFVYYFNEAWYNSGITDFPDINCASGRYFTDTWRNTSLTSFPKLEMPNALSLESAWRSCDNLVEFPQIIFPFVAKNFKNTWRSCDILTTFPANCFDNCNYNLDSDAFQNAWTSCALSAQSIENILVSLVATNVYYRQLGISGGTNAGRFSSWSTNAETAYNTLISRGWTISYNN